MGEVLQFIFGSFWRWAGTVVLICVAGEALGFIVREARIRAFRRTPRIPPMGERPKTAPVHFTEDGVLYTTAAEILASEKGRAEIARAANRTPEIPCSRPSCKRNRERLEVLEARIRELEGRR